MALAPLRAGPHTVRADRLAFATPVPVREASAAGHWVTVGHHGEDDEGGGVHIFISSGGTVEKGPRGLLGHHIGAVASHPSAGKTQHHPAGHEPPGARDHPHYAEAAPTPPVAPGEVGKGEATKRPGKPYARLHGAEQGTRHEQIGKALGEAQGAAKGAKAATAQDTAPQAVKPLEGKPAQEAGARKGTFGERREATVKAMQDKAQRERATYRVLGTSDDQTTCEICGKKDLKKTVALHHDQSGEVVRAGSDCAAELLKTSRGSIEKAAKQHGEKRDAAIEKALESHPNQEIIKRFAGKIDRINQVHRANKSTPSETEQGMLAHARQRIGELTAEAKRDIEKQLPADKPLPEKQIEQRVVHGRTVRTEKPAAPFVAPQTDRPADQHIADAAVAHQQAQAELAAHRAKADRNPNPWAPHLSPPVGDARDRELAEKATRAQLAHHAAQAQQQGTQQHQQQEGQRAHEKEMVRLKAETAQPKPAFTAPQPQAKEKPQTSPQPEQPAARPQPEPEHPAISALRNTSGYLQIKYLAPGVMRPSPESSQIIKQHHDPIIKAAEAADPSHPLHRDPEYLQARQYMNESAHKATEEYKAAQRNAPTSIPSTREPGIPAGHMLVSPHGEHAITGTADKFHLVNRKTGEVLASHDTMSGIKRALAKAQKGTAKRPVRESASPAARFSAPIPAR